MMIMCGIVGCVLKNKKVAPILLDCISKLEYRGYDSVGIATENDKDRKSTRLNSSH